MGNHFSAGGGHKRSLLKRAGLRAALHLVRHHPGAALSAAGAGVGYAARELLREGLGGARRAGERMRTSVRSKRWGRMLARAYDRQELEALADLRKPERPNDPQPDPTNDFPPEVPDGPSR